MGLGKVLRDDFPFFQHHPDIVYMDNACMSLRPQQVLAAMREYYESMSACAGRSNHRLATAVTEAVDEAREQVRAFIGAKHADEVIFTRNTTEGMNLLAATLPLSEGDVVVTSDKEHNSNLVPWLRLKEMKNIKHVVLNSKEDNTFDMRVFEQVLATEQVKVVSLVHTSNLDGVTFPLKEITDKAHKAGALVLVDGAQSVPHGRIDVTDLGVDALAFSVHKMMGPSGMGVLYMSRDLMKRLNTYMVGGDTVEYTTYGDYVMLEPPERYEAGLQNYAGIIGTGAAASYLMELDLDELTAHEHRLNQIISDELSGMERVRILGPSDANLRGGVVSFTVDEVDAHQVALMLDKTAGIMVRSGQHCVHSWFNAHEIQGSIRASLYAYNTEEEAAYFVESFKKVLAVV